MKKLSLALLLVIITGCSSSPPLPPEPQGNWTPVNVNGGGTHETIQK